MNITKVDSTSGFQPYSLCINIDTKEEHTFPEALTYYDMTLPNAFLKAFCRDGGDNVEEATTFMTQFLRAIDHAIHG